MAADIEAIARRIFEAYCARTGNSIPNWSLYRDEDSEPLGGFRMPGRETFRIMAGASLPPVTGTLILEADPQEMG